MKNIIYSIKITNFDDHQKNLKRGHKAILLSTGFLSDPKIRLLTPATKLLFLSCLLVAGESTSSQINVSHDSLCFQSGVKSGSLQSQLDRLQSLQLLSYEKINPLYNRIEKNRIEKKRNKNIIKNSAQNNLSVLDFEEVYKNYPRKIGKSSGIKKAKIEIKNLEDLEKLKKSVENYKKFLSTNKTEAKFIKHFSTFMTSWRDWLDPDVGKTEKLKSETDYSFLQEA